MKPADGVVSDAVDTGRTHWRGALFGVGLAIVAGLLVLFAPQPAHADDSPGLLGGVLDGVSTTAAAVTQPVLEPLPDARQLPVVGGIVGRVADSSPASSVTKPVAQLLDGTLGGTVGSLPVVGGLLGDTPVGDVTSPVGGVVDGALGEVAGPTAAAPHGSDPAATAAGATGALAGVARALPLLSTISTISSVGELGIVVATGAGGSDHGPVSVPGGLTPTSAVTASGSPIGLATAVLGAGLLLLLARGRLRPVGLLTPPSPVYGTDTSPD
ncbi:MAG: hypothetical protein QM598_04050 [Protaetiibacter sp.]